MALILPDEKEDKEAGDGTATSANTSNTATGQFTPFVAFCFTINYILGTGFLTIPWAFVQGGLVLSPTVILAVGLISGWAMSFLVETMATAEAMLDVNLDWITVRRNDGENRSDSDYGALLTSSADAPSTATTAAASPPISAPPYQVQNQRKFEVNALCRIFLGKTGLHLYTITICLYLYGACWAFTSVFASAMATTLPLHNNTSADMDMDLDPDYLIYALLFAVIVVPLTCMELKEQVIIQVTLTGARFLLIGFMIATSQQCALDNHTDNHLINDYYNPHDDTSTTTTTITTTTTTPLFQFSHIHKMLPIIVFANIYHHGVPGLSHPVADKTKLLPIFASSTIFITLVYTWVGLQLAWSFGDTIQQSSNLHWNTYTGGTAVVVHEHDDNGGETVTVSIAPWAKAVSLYVVIFPALDVISAFPLNAITLGDNLFGAYYGSQLYLVENNRRIRTYFRLLASIPPILFGILERRLGTITDYTGTTGLLMAFSFPALLYLRSRALAKQKGFSVWTYYSCYSSTGYLSSSSIPAAWLVFVLGIVIYVLVLYNLLRGS